MLLGTRNLLLSLEECRCRFDLVFYSYQITFSSGAYERARDEKKNQTKKDPTIEKLSTMTPALRIVLLSYISILRDKHYRFYLLGNKCMYGYTLSKPSCLVGFMLCIRYMYTSQFCGVTDILELQVYATVWRGLCYPQDAGILLLSP